MGDKRNINQILDVWKKMWKIDAYHDLGSMIIALVSMVSWHKFGSSTLRFSIANTP